MNENFDPERDYYEVFKAEFSRSRDSEGHTLMPYLVLKCVLAFASRVGFIFIHVGSIPVENVYSIVVYNLLEISVGILSYGLIGNLIAFRTSTAEGWISLGKWKWDDVSSMTQDSNLSLIGGFCSILLATAQMSSFLVGRTKLVGGMLLTAFYSGIFQPFLMHWIWHESGWMRLSKFLNVDVSVQDHAGVLALHIPSVILGTTGSLFLGRRILKLREIDGLSFGTEHVIITVIGYLLIIFNYIIFALPMYEVNNENVALIVINGFLAVGAGIFTVTIFQCIIFRDISHHRRIIRSVQGGVAGLISIAAAINLYTPSVTIMISIITSIVFFFFAELIHNTALEDPCSFVSSHLICGFIGVMVCPLAAQKENFGYTARIEILGVHLLWQFICTCAVIGMSVVVALFLFLLLLVSRILKNRFEIANHKRAAVLRDALTKRAYLERLFSINSTTDYVVPGYWKSFFDTDKAADKGKRACVNNIILSDGDKLRGNEISQGENNTGFNATVVQVTSGQVPANVNANWLMYGSGDYNPDMQRKNVANFKNPTDVRLPRHLMEKI
ncbi:ammonium transporter 2-like [Anoplophora glabripennis]|uniref:ammonium transporter 2-like n=1 Tax=Anoplophora glabripennis TaxID=217634 RepID=UPI000874D004|nr:ammonium transporter 2-like [Anoplophora glabripennis]